MSPMLAALIGLLVGAILTWLGINLFRPFSVGANVTISEAVCEGTQIRVRGTVTLNTGTTGLSLRAFVYDDPAQTAEAVPPSVGIQDFAFNSPFDILVDVPATNSGSDCVAVWAKLEGYSAGATSQAVPSCTSTTTTSTTTTTTTTTSTTTTPPPPRP